MVAGVSGPDQDDAEPGVAAASAPAGPDSVRRSMAWTVFGYFSFAAALWVSQMVIAKLGSAEALGRYSLGLAIATPAIIFAGLHMRPIYVVDTRSRWPFSHYFGLRLVMQPLALVVIVAICLLRGWPWLTVAVVCLVGVIRVADSVTDILYARAQRAEKMDSIGISQAVRGGLWVGLLALGLVLGDELLALSLVAGALVAHTLLYDLRKAAAHGADANGALRPRFDRDQLKSLAWEALPMGLAGGILAVSANVFAYVLEGQHGLEAVGYFAAVLSIRQAAGVVNMAVGNAAISRLSKLAVFDARGFWILLAKLLALVLALNGLGLVLIIVFGELFLVYAYTPESRRRSRPCRSFACSSLSTSPTSGRRPASACGGSPPGACTGPSRPC